MCLSQKPKMSPPTNQLLLPLRNLFCLSPEVVEARKMQFLAFFCDLYALSVTFLPVELLP